MKKIRIILMAVLLVSLGVLCGCQEEVADNPEAIAAAKALFLQAETVNRAIWGTVSYDESEEAKNYNGGSYQPVSEDFPYESLDGIKEAIEAVYSEEYCESIFVSLFGPEEGETLAEDEVLGQLAPRYTEMFDRIYVNTSYASFDLKNKILPETAHITANGGYYVAIKVSYGHEGGTGADGEMELIMLHEEDGWRFDSPTY